MSEHTYAAKQPTSFADVDHSGTLFEEIYPGGETPVIAPNERPKEPVNLYPETLEVRKASALKREMARQAILSELATREHTAYEDINPSTRHLPTVTPHDVIVLGYEPWQQEVRTGIEQLGLLSLTSEMVKVMTNEDRRRLGKHAEQFLLLLVHRPRIIKTFGGDTTSHATFHGTYGARTRVEMLEYADRLIVLKDELLRSPAIHGLLYAAKESQSNAAIRKASVMKDKDSNRYLQVYFDESPQGTIKPRTTLETRTR